jgi:hypothetical protein
MLLAQQSTVPSSPLLCLINNPYDKRMLSNIMRFELCLPVCGRGERVGEGEAEEAFCGCCAAFGGVGAATGECRDAEEGDADGLVAWWLGEVAQGELKAGEVGVVRGVGLQVEEGAVEVLAGVAAAGRWAGRLGAVVKPGEKNRWFTTRSD